MKILFRTCALLIIGLGTIYITGCSEDVEQDIDPVAIDTIDIAPAREEPAKPVDEPIATNGKPVNVTDATFEAVVLEAELPVVLELGAEW